MFKGHYDEIIEVISIDHGFHVYTIVEHPKSEHQRVIYGIAYLDEDTHEKNIYNAYFNWIVYMGDTIVSNFDERNLYEQAIRLGNGEVMCYYELIERNIVPKNTQLMILHQDRLDTKSTDMDAILARAFREAMIWYDDAHVEETVLL